MTLELPGQEMGTPDFVLKRPLWWMVEGNQLHESWTVEAQFAGLQIP